MKRVIEIWIRLLAVFCAGLTFSATAETIGASVDVTLRIGVGSAAGNRAALQKALDTVSDATVVTVAGEGVYDCYGPLVIRGGTTLVFGPDVKIRRQAEPGVIANSFLINKAALDPSPDAGSDDGITVRGLHLVANGVDPWWSKPVLRQGICSQVSFYRVKNLVVEDYECLDLPEQGFGLQVCTFENIRIENVHIEGKKDGVHLGPGKNFVIRNGVFRTYDDPIALNAHDYAISNPEVGWIENGLIENCTDLDQSTTEGFFCRFPIGAWGEWKKGMSVRCSDSVLHDGKLYRVIMPPDGKTYVSTTCPTQATGYAELDGITWYMMQKTDLKNAAVKNVTFRNITLRKRRNIAFAITTEDHEWHRAIAPGCTPPRCEKIRIEDLKIDAPVNELVMFQAPGDIKIVSKTRSVPAIRGAFKKLGFDPTAPGCGWFVVSSDVHAADRSQNFAATVADWNTMDPKPARVLLLGDNVTMNQFFGNIPPPKEKARIASYFTEFKTQLGKLDPSIPVTMCIGNHDENPDEENAVLFRKEFPDFKPYEIFDMLGMTFFKWNGGHDGAFDAAQADWIRKTAADLPRNKTLVVLVHQPGDLAIDRGPKAMAREVLADRTGETWLLAGHKHGDSGARYTLPGGGELALQVHRMNKLGYWVYGVKDGSIVARVMVDKDRECHPQLPREEMKLEGPLPLALDGRDDVVWTAWIGSEAEKNARVDIAESFDAGTFLSYADKLLYRFPKGTVAPRATRLAVVGDRLHHKLNVPKNAEPVLCTFELSTDGKNWTKVPTPEEKAAVYEIPLPEEFRNAETLWFRWTGFHMGSGFAGGFAFLK